MSYLYTNKIGKLYLGSTEIAKAYLGTDLVYQSGGVTPVDPGDISNYISDGLVFHIDGKECAGGTVTDLVTNNTFTIGVPASVSFSDDAIVLNGGYLYRSGTMLSSNSNYTIEVCFSPTSMSAACCLFTSGQNSTSTKLPNVIFPSSGSYITFVARGGTTYAPAIAVDGKYTISMNASRGIRNGTAMSTTTTNYYANQNYTVIGARRYSNSFSQPYKGKIYSIRAYSRQLTEAEMLQNQAVDNARFNLGLNI